MSPDFLGTTTIPAHQDVGSVTLDITPNDSIQFNSSSTLSRNGIGTFLGVCKAWGLASYFKVIVYGSPKLPNPVNTLGNSFLTSASKL